jgi:putative nucleotidyltransferase with HDIG domain
MNRGDEILAKVRSITSLPTLAVKVFQLLQDPDVNMDELTRTIEFDPGLTTNTLRLANSAWFSCVRKIGSVNEAILRLGTDTVFQLVVASTVAPMARCAIKGYDLSPGELWKHSVAVAVCVDEMATALRIKPPNHAFTAALLHDTGKIVIGTFVEVDVAPITELAFQDNVPFEEAERRVLGIDHAEVGAVVLQNWNLPLDIVETVRCHHQPDRISGDTLPVDLVHAADTLCMAGGIGTGIDGLNYLPSKAVVSRLQLTTQMAETVVCQTLARLDDMQDLFTQNTER